MGNKASFEVKFPTETMRKRKQGSISLKWGEGKACSFSPAIILDSLPRVSTSFVIFCLKVRTAVSSSII